MSQWKIEAATEEDFEWIEPLFNENKNILGPASTAIYWWKSHPIEKRDPFVVVRPHAFAHFKRKRNGEVTLYEIAVDAQMKRKGIGRALMDYAGYPMILKTDADNKESNNFYKTLGFICMGQKQTRSGKMVNIYQRFS